MFRPAFFASNVPPLRYGESFSGGYHWEKPVWMSTVTYFTYRSSALGTSKKRGWRSNQCCMKGGGTRRQPALRMTSRTIRILLGPHACLGHPDTAQHCKPRTSLKMTQLWMFCLSCATRAGQGHEQRRESPPSNSALVKSVGGTFLIHDWRGRTHLTVSSATTPAQVVLGYIFCRLS